MNIGQDNTKNKNITTATKAAVTNSINKLRKFSFENARVRRSDALNTVDDEDCQFIQGKYYNMGS